MSASYPSTIATFSTHSDTTDTIFAADVNTPNAEIVAIETGLLNGFQHDLLPLADDAKSIGSTAKRWLKLWAQDADIDGTLTLSSGLVVASGGTGVATLAAHGVVIGEGTSAVAVTTPGTAGQPFVSNGASADPTFQNPASVGSSLVLLKAGNGTSTAAGATTLDSVALPVLTANDTILVYFYCESVTQQTTTPSLYSVTDSAAINNLQSQNSGNLAISGMLQGTVQLTQRQGTNTNYIFNSSGISPSGNSAFFNAGVYGATATWVSGWTLGLRHGGVTAGGTFKWQWAVYRVLGQ